MSNNGKQGEQLFKQIMESRKYTIKDVSNDPDFWYRDIDFIAESPFSGDIKTFEVKWDTKIHQTGNLYLERSNIRSKGGAGWFDFCEADYLAYGDAVNKLFYVIPMKELRERADQLPYRSASCGYDSTGQLVSLKDIEDITRVLAASAKSPN